MKTPFKQLTFNKYIWKVRWGLALTGGTELIGGERAVQRGPKCRQQAQDLQSRTYWAVSEAVDGKRQWPGCPKNGYGQGLPEG